MRRIGIWQMLVTVLVACVLTRPAVWLFEAYRDLCIGMEWISGPKAGPPPRSAMSPDNPFR